MKYCLTSLVILISSCAETTIDGNIAGLCFLLMSLVSMITFLLLLGYIVCTSPLVYLKDDGAQRLFQTETIAAMERIGDRRALKYLMQADMGVSVMPHLHALILRLLPLIGEEDREWLGEVGGKWLAVRLHVMASAQSTLTLLKATAILGDERLIRTVDKISQSKSAEIRAEALRVLAVLESRRDAKKEKRELLRASAIPDDYKETLLRPLQDRYDPQEERELLHPSDKPEE